MENNWIIAEKKTIVFVPRRSRIRPYKIAKALSSTGRFRLVLICEGNFYDENLFEGIFDDVKFYKKPGSLAKNKYAKYFSDRFNPNFSKLGKLIRKTAPDLIHAFCEPYDHIQYILKNFDIPVVMSDGADFSGISAGIENLDSRTREQEQFCFENVKGLIYKGPPRVVDFYRAQGYRIDAQELTWFDHCDEDLFQDPVFNKDQPIHMVYSGNISTDPSVKYCYYIPLAKALSQQGIHFHLYPNPYQFKTSPEYQQLDKTDEFFHFHKPKPMKELTKEIAQYDWGLWIHAEDPSLRTSPDKMKTGIGNKLFSYLEAGLPVIVSDSREYGVQIIEEHEIGFSLADKDWSKLGEIIQGLDSGRIHENVLKKRKVLSLQNNAYKLEDHYEKVLSK